MLAVLLTWPASGSAEEEAPPPSPDENAATEVEAPDGNPVPPALVTPPPETEASTRPADDESVDPSMTPPDGTDTPAVPPTDPLDEAGDPLEAEPQEAPRTPGDVESRTTAEEDPAPVPKEQEPEEPAVRDAHTSRETVDFDWDQIWTNVLWAGFLSLTPLMLVVAAAAIAMATTAVISVIVALATLNALAIPSGLFCGCILNACVGAPLGALSIAGAVLIGVPATTFAAMCGGAGGEEGNAAQADAIGAALPGVAMLVVGAGGAAGSAALFVAGQAVSAMLFPRSSGWNPIRGPLPLAVTGVTVAGGIVSMAVFFGAPVAALAGLAFVDVMQPMEASAAADPPDESAPPPRAEASPPEDRHENVAH